MRVRLERMDGAVEIPLDRPLTLIGRQEGCDVRLEFVRVSRRHCCLAPLQDGVAVRDLGSSNGTWINGERVSEGLLHPGDELTIGPCRYRLTIGTPGTTELMETCADAETAPAGARTPGHLRITASDSQLAS